MKNYFSAVTAAEWLIFGGMLVGLFACIGIAEILRKTTALTGNATRKIVHVLVGVFVFFVPLVFESPVPGVLMSVLFIVVNYVSVRFKVFKGMDDTNRETYGTVYFPLAFLILILLFWDSYRVIISTSILVLGLADAAASIVGESIREPRLYNLAGARKSYEGSAAMFSVTFIVTVGCLLWYPREALPVSGFDAAYLIGLALVVASVATVVEAVAARGLDNLYVPLSVSLILYVGLAGVDEIGAQIFVGFLFAVVISLISLRLRFLSPSGAAATFLMAVVIFGIGGWKWTIPMLTFFVLSSVISKMKHRRKEEAEEYFEKMHQRDMGQVAANGIVASSFVVLEFIWSDPVFYVAYLGAIAAATADTWGTELGISFSTSTRSILTWRKIPRGLSGGVSLTGIIAGLAGGVIIGLSGSVWLQSDFNQEQLTYALVGLIAGSGVAGSLFDSILGASVQAQYQCTRCGKVTERREHCEVAARKVRGFHSVNNDYVNFASTVMGAAVAVFLFLMVL